MTSKRKDRPAFVVAFVAIVSAVTSLVFVGVTSAHQDPAGCNANDFILQVEQSPGPAFAPGTTVNYTVSAGNTGPPATGCNATGVTITLVTPDGNPHVLEAGFSYPFPTSIDLAGAPVPYTVDLADAVAGPCGNVLVCPQVVATAHATGVLHDSDGADDGFTFDKQLSGPITWTHLQCWQLKRGGAVPAAVPVVDQFGTATVRPKVVHAICNPADKNDEDPSAASNPNHEMGYTARASRSPGAGRLVRVTNQFGTIVVELSTVRSLLVPASKSTVAPPAPLAPVGIDHFLCYGATGSSKTNSAFHTVSNIKVHDQFATMLLNAVSIDSFCVPADVNGTTPGAENDPITLLCYRVKLATGQTKTKPPSIVYSNDDFGPHTLTPDGNVMPLCVPSLAVTVN